MASFIIKTKDTCSKYFFDDNTIIHVLSKIIFMQYYSNTVKLK